MTDDEALETLFAMANVQDGYAKKATDPVLKVIHKVNAKAQREIAATIKDLRARLAAAEGWVAASKKAAQDYCWQRYKGREPLNLSSPAVFTSHEWQKIGEAIDAALATVTPPADTGNAIKVNTIGVKDP